MSRDGQEFRCHHCGAKRPNLHPFTERYLDTGKVLVVRCLLCGWRAVDLDLGSYKPLGWSSPWPRKQEEWVTLDLSGAWGTG